MHVSIWVCAPTRMQRPEEDVRPSSLLLYLSALRHGLSVNWKLTFSARLPGCPGSSQYPRLCPLPVLGLQVCTGMLSVFFYMDAEVLTQVLMLG